MSILTLLPEVAAKIAAGEVVERPASIVKELIENAIDAGATRISVDMQGGGITSLRVTDNGGGIPRDELPVAFARHATSKLTTVEDLNHLHTLGFRGEALASVGAVALVTVASRPAEGENGARLTMAHGLLEKSVPTAMPPGTIVTVRDLFAQVPARLKFLKTPQSEAATCIILLERYALAYPHIQFTVAADSRLVLRTPGDGSLVNAAAQVYDVKVAEQLVPVTYGTEPEFEQMALVDRPPVISGVTTRPAAYKSTKQHIHIFVNRRWVRSQSLSFAVEEAYHSLLLTGRHPISVIFVDIDPSLVDVNVHPAKTEVKFARERQVFAAVQRAVRAAVVGTSAAPAVSHHAFTAVGIDVTALDDNSATTAPTASVSVASTLSAPVRTASPTPSLWNAQDLRRTALPANDLRAVATPAPAQQLPALRVLGQVSQSYIITEGPDGVYLIDQHAAHERILLEKMVKQWQASEMPAQALLEPMVIELLPEIFVAVDEHIEQLRRISFAIEPFGATAMLVRAIPAPLAKSASAAALADLLAELVGVDHAGHAETWEEHVLANIACKAAIKAGQPLTPEEQRELVRQLESADARHSCCHGRPTTVHLSIDALEREFARR